METRIDEQVRFYLRQSLDEAVPNRELLVLYALETAGRSDGLTVSEQEALDEARPALEAALTRHPGLQVAVERIQTDASAFAAHWKAEQGKERRAADRPPRVARRQRRRWNWRVPATLVVAMLAGLWFFADPDASESVLIQTAAGEMQDLALPDGSTVRLMENSKLAYTLPQDPTAFDRKVRLEGKGYFDVRTNPEHRFEVETDGALATVLGTSFGIETRSGETEVVLATGKLMLASKDAPQHQIALAPRQMSRVHAGNNPVSPVDVDLVEALEWTGKFVFQPETYSRIAECLSRHYRVPVTVDPDVADDKFSGTFEQTDELPHILNVVARGELKVETVESGGYRLSRAE